MAQSRRTKQYEQESAGSPDYWTKHPQNSAPKIKWWGVAGGERVRRNHGMQFYSYDATCDSCGWDSGSGGAIQASIQRDVQDHRRDHAAVQSLAQQEGGNGAQ